MKLVLLAIISATSSLRIKRSGWEYTDHGTDWGTAYPTCSEARQSPIDIPAGISGTKISSPFLKQNYDAKLSWDAVNNGHAVQINVDDTSSIKISGGGLSGDYILAQFHFHWGSATEGGAEHLVAGQRHFAEIHLVHFKEEYGTIDAALDQGDGLAVLGFFVQSGAETGGALDSFINSKIAKNIEVSASEADITDFAMDDVLPDNLDNYYRYFGSLTTPTCNEAVVWTVFNDPIMITDATRDLMTTFAQKSDSSELTKNYRAVQPINDREITFYSTSAEPESQNDPAAETEPEPEAEAGAARNIVHFVVLALVVTFQVL